MNVFLNWLAPAGVQALFVSWAVQGALLGLCVLAGLAVSGRVRKAFGFGWLCRQWLLMALLFLVPVQRLAQMLSATALEPLFIIKRFPPRRRCCPARCNGGRRCGCAVWRWCWRGT